MSITVSVRKVKNDILLGRKQFILDVFHSEKPNIPKKLRGTDGWIRTNDP